MMMNIAVKRLMKMKINIKMMMIMPPMMTIEDDKNGDADNDDSHFYSWSGAQISIT